MTDEEAFLVVATKAGAFTVDELKDFCAQPPAVKARIARVYQSAIFEQGGPGAWEEFLVVFGTVADVASKASGLKDAYDTFRALV